MKLSRPLIIRSALIGAAVVALLGLGLWQATVGNALLLWLRTDWLGFLIVFVAVAGFLWVNRDPHRSTLTSALITGLPALALLIVVAGLNGYTQRHIYLGGYTQTADPTGTFAERVPWDVAAAVAPNKITDVGTVDINDTTYIADTGTYTTPVYGKNPLGNMAEVVALHRNPDGTTATTICQFTPGHDLKLGGWFGQNLDRQIVYRMPFVRWDASDAYALCNPDGTPLVVVPLLQPAGFWPVVNVPAGVAIFNGHTGTLDILTDVQPGQVPGPVYPMSLAKYARASTGASGSFPQFLFGQVGWEDTSGIKDDPNGGNNAEFTLATTSGGIRYVTPLTVRGGSTAIAAVGVVQADRVTAGQLNPLTVHTISPARDSNLLLAQTIKGTFPEMAWATPGFGVFEIVPSGPGRWVATLGFSQTFTNRVVVDSTGMCLTDAVGRPVRCATPGGGTTGSASGINVKDMTDAQLQALLRQIADEWAKRHP